MPYKYTDKHPMYRGRRIPCGTLIDDPDNPRLLGLFRLGELVKAGVAAEISKGEADEIKRAQKEYEDNVKKAREGKPKAAPPPTPETKEPKGGES